MIERFQGADGRRRLVEAFSAQWLVSGDRDLASALADAATLESVPPSRMFIEQDAATNDLFLILSGLVSIQVNGREVARRVATR